MKKLFIAMMLVLVIATSGWAIPTPITTTAIYYLTKPNTALESHEGPYATVEIDWVSSTEAFVKVDTIGWDKYGGYLIGDGGSIALNVAGQNITANTFKWLGGTDKTYYPKKISSGVESTFGEFNFTVDGHDGYTCAVRELTFFLYNTNDAWSDATNVLKENAYGYFAAGHIFVKGDDGALDTGFAANGSPPPSVPEPGTILLLGGGLLGLGFFNRKRMKA